MDLLLEFQLDDLVVQVVELSMCQDLELVLVVGEHQDKDILVDLFLQDLMPMVLVVVVLVQLEILLLHRVDLVVMEYIQILQEALFNVVAVEEVVKIIQELLAVVVLAEVELVKLLLVLQPQELLIPEAVAVAEEVEVE